MKTISVERRWSNKASKELFFVRKAGFSSPLILDREGIAELIDGLDKALGGTNERTNR